MGILSCLFGTKPEGPFLANAFIPLYSCTTHFENLAAMRMRISRYSFVPKWWQGSIPIKPQFTGKSRCNCTRCLYSVFVLFCVVSMLLLTYLILNCSILCTPQKVKYCGKTKIVLTTQSTALELQSNLFRVMVWAATKNGFMIKNR